MTRGARAPRPPEPPRLDDDLDERPLDPASIADGLRVEGARLADADLSGARLRGLRLADVAIERGNFANTAAPELDARRIAVAGARLTGAQWTAGTIADATFRDYRIDLATFAGTKFELVIFDGCMLAPDD